MVAFHYPPVQGSSGVHRALAFSRYLPDYGWQPIVLTATLGAYASIDISQSSRIPGNVLVERAVALDSGRHFAVRGAYPRWLALPDRWISWWPGGVAKGLALIRRHRPQLIWSTFPIATAHLIALALNRVTGIPWVADFRDPMTETNPDTGENFPADPVRRRVYAWIERPSITRCAKAVFTTPGAAAVYAERFGDGVPERSAIIQNGFDEESFQRVQSSARPAPEPGRILLLHAGVLYPDSRNPRCFFEALAHLRARGEISGATLKVLLRGSGDEALHRFNVKRLGIDDVVSLEATVPYEKALAEMLTADGLVIFQGSDSNRQIPAKVYEYLRARRPILAFVDPKGDTAKLLQSEGMGMLAPIDSTPEIVSALRDFLRKISRRGVAVPTGEQVTRHSRRFRTHELACLFDSIVEATDPARACRPLRPTSHRSP